MPVEEMPIPGIWRRMACWLYESLLLFGVIFLPGYLFVTLTQSRHGLDYRNALQIFLFVVLGIYFVWFWSRGQTLAMKTWQVRLVDRQGNAVSQQRALLRYILSWVWLLPPLALCSWLGVRPAWMGLLVLAWIVLWANLSRFHKQGQFWHDAWAGTRLVSQVK